MKAKTPRFFKDDDFEFVFLLALGATYHKAADVSEAARASSTKSKPCRCRASSSRSSRTSAPGGWGRRATPRSTSSVSLLDEAEALARQLDDRVPMRRG
jgi:hypothetical protein